MVYVFYKGYFVNNKWILNYFVQIIHFNQSTLVYSRYEFWLKQCIKRQRHEWSRQTKQNKFRAVFNVWSKTYNLSMSRHKIISYKISYWCLGLLSLGLHMPQTFMKKPCMRNKMSLKKHFMFNQYFMYMVNYLTTQETLNKLLSCLGTAEIYQIHI